VEQNRAPAVLPDLDELARQAADQPRGHRQPIASTRTRTGLTVAAELDTGQYPKGIKISDQQMRDLEQGSLRCYDWHPGWNYSLATPRPA